MAFDMFFDESRVFIDGHEEDIFYIIDQDERFPKLNWVWQNFYSDPKIHPELGNDLVHELTLLKSVNSEKAVKDITEKLIPFFSKAHQQQRMISTESD